MLSDLDLYMWQENKMKYFYSSYRAGEFYSSRHLFTHLGFPECPCCLEYDMYSRLCCVLWTYGFRLTDDGRLLPLLYMYLEEV